MSYTLNDNSAFLSDNDLQSIQQILFQLNYTPNPPFLAFKTDNLDNVKDFRQLMHTINTKIKYNSDLSNNILNLFRNSLGDTSGTQLGNDLDSVITDIFSSGNGNVVKLILYILFELRPTDFSSLSTLQDEGLIEEDTIGYRLNNLNNNIFINSIPDTLGAPKQVLRVTIDGSGLEWADSSGGSDAYLPDREVLGEGQYMLITDSDVSNNPLRWRNVIDCGIWESIQ